MREEYFTARANLRQRLRQHPDWTIQRLAEDLQMSASWVKKWKKRLLEADPLDLQVLQGQSTARHRPPEQLDEQVVDCLLHYRDEPPEELGRTPGPKALLYYLPRAQDWQELGVRLPRSSSTIYRIRKRGRSYLVPTPSSCRSFPLARGRSGLANGCARMLPSPRLTPWANTSMWWRFSMWSM